MDMSFEERLERNPLRKHVRELMEIRCIRKATTIEDIGNALHIACGNGKSTQQLLKHFVINEVHAIDTNKRYIDDAKSVLETNELKFLVQNLSSIEFEDNKFDVVFDLAELHNYGNWKSIIDEIYRVLKPNGLFVLEEISTDTFSHGTGKYFKKMTEHPYDLMFSEQEFIDYLESKGLKIQYLRKRNILGVFRYFILSAVK